MNMSCQQSRTKYSSGILLEFFWNSPRILLDFFWTSSGILLEFFWNSSGILLEFFWITNWKQPTSPIFT